ncbi:MAG: amino acid permease, partial [Candidatus Rokubacteria bacterium]|nr:amino acid permease [Candidatus Rokubacteria bacterium]
FNVSGGPYGIENAVASFGPGLALLLLMETPLVWSLPVSLAMSEMAGALPAEGGYVTWVRRAFGPFWGFQVGWWSWLNSFVDVAVYPALFADYLRFWWPGMSAPARWALALGFIQGAHRPEHVAPLAGAPAGSRRLRRAPAGRARSGAAVARQRGPRGHVADGGASRGGEPAGHGDGRLAQHGNRRGRGTHGPRGVRVVGASVAIARPRAALTGAAAGGRGAMRRPCRRAARQTPARKAASSMRRPAQLTRTGGLSRARRAAS